MIDLPIHTQETLKVEDLRQSLKLICSEPVRQFLDNPSSVAYNTVEEINVLVNKSEFYGYERKTTLCQYAQLIVSYNKNEHKAKVVGLQLLNDFIAELIKDQVIFKVLGIGVMQLTGLDTLRDSAINRSGREAITSPYLKNGPDYVCEPEFQKHRMMFFFYMHPDIRWSKSQSDRVIMDKLNSWCDIHKHQFRFYREGELSQKEVIVF